MQRRQLLIRGAGITSLAISLSGCTGDGTDGDGSMDPTEGSESDVTTGTSESTDTDHPTDTAEGSNGGHESGSGPAEVGESGLQRMFTNNVETVEILAVEEVEVTEARVEVDITLRNTADEPANLHNYVVRIHLFEGEEPTGWQGEGMMDYTGTSTEFEDSEQDQVPPNETTTLRYSTVRSGDSEATVQSYQIVVDCSSMHDLPCN